MMQSSSLVLKTANSLFKEKKFGLSLAFYNYFCKQCAEISHLVDFNIIVSKKNFKIDQKRSGKKTYVYFCNIEESHDIMKFVLPKLEAMPFDMTVIQFEIKDGYCNLLIVINDDLSEKIRCFDDVMSGTDIDMQKDIHFLIEAIKEKIACGFECLANDTAQIQSSFVSQVLGMDIKKCETIDNIDFVLTLLRKRNNAENVKYSVIVPAFNSEQFVGRAIESILMQKKQCEIIIFNDGSSDMTDDIVNVYHLMYDNITIINSNINVGQGIGRNIALSYACGEYIVFVDSDDYYADSMYFDKIEKGAFQKHNPDVVVTPYIRKRNSILNKDNIELGVYSGPNAIQVFVDRGFGTHGPGGKFFKRSALTERAKFVEYGYSQDVLFTIKALRNVSTVLSTNIYSYVYDNSTVSSWRPNKLTAKHFYSSLRLLLEIHLEALNLAKINIKISLNKFLLTWEKDHAKRLESYLSGNFELDDFFYATINSMSYYINLIPKGTRASYILQNVYNNAMNKKKIVHGSDCYVNHMLKLVSSLDSEIKKIPIKQSKPIIVIYVSHLSSGGLEKVACQLGEILSEKFDVVYLLDSINKISYKNTGLILKADLSDHEVLGVLEHARFIFDFKYKNVTEEFPMCAYIVNKYFNKYICTIHNTKTCQNYFEKVKFYFNNDIASLYAILCVSHAVKTRFLDLYGNSNNISVIYNPVDFCAIESSKPQNEFNEKYILFVGRLNATQHKGIDLLVKAFSKSQAIESHKLVLAGAGCLDEKIHQFIASNNLENKIISLGFRDDIYSYMKNATFVFQPSRWEGFSLALIESLACGTPVLSSTAGGAREVIEHKKNGYLVDINDLNGFISGINYMIFNADNMRKVCRNSVNRFSMDSYRCNVLQLLKCHEQNVLWQ